MASRYPTVEEGNKKGILLIVTAGKDGALNGGPEFMKAVGDNFIDSIISENIPIFTQVRRILYCMMPPIFLISSAGDYCLLLACALLATLGSIASC